MSFSAAIVRAVSPRDTHRPTTPACKRKILPSAEESSSKKALLITPSKMPKNISQSGELSVQPFHAPQQRFPRGIAHIVHQYPRNNPLPVERDKNGGAPWHNRHVLVPYNLRDPSVNIYEAEIRPLLYNIFPGTKSVTQARFRGYLVFQVTDLPSAPWPITVGGLPITISEARKSGKGRALIFPRQRSGRPSISILHGGFNANRLSDKSLRKLALNVNTYFKQNFPAVHILELLFTCERTFYVIVGDHVELNTMNWPARIASYPVGYLHNKDLNRPDLMYRPANREIEPQPLRGIVDDTDYDILRPGVMISNSTDTGYTHPASTAGVLVKNPAGNIFMTAASHAIGVTETACRPRRPTETIGKAVAEISFTDVCLIKLDRGIQFSTQTFKESDGICPQFTRLVTSDDKFGFSTCYLNSLYTGLMDANIIMKSVKIQAEGTSNSTEERLRYVAYEWLYHGQEESSNGGVELPDGVSGSSIWNDDGIIRGFYQFFIREGQWKGFSACVSASEAVEAGYTLAT
ncbi:hypothetical protein F4677DRAFT_463552 [Hypoxylon crocopeplum]|nr:hypothetical protein F4677DRAFT_463552 [Hypoxylon crocopeplum]